MNQIASRWEDYECIDAGNGEKLERWKDIILRRPDPLALWPIAEESGLWLQPHARYHRSAKGGGHWEYLKQLPESWNVRYRQLCFKVSPTGFKHTGLFPEQAANWDFMMEKIAGADREIRVLNLFAYTGGATMACAAAGAQEVVHVDAAKGMVQWAKENMVLSHLEDRRIRFIVDDVLKFVAREKRRGRTYHAIIMDPPSYGRGPKRGDLEDRGTALSAGQRLPGHPGSASALLPDQLIYDRLPGQRAAQHPLLHRAPPPSCGKSGGRRDRPADQRFRYDPALRHLWALDRRMTVPDSLFL